MPPPLHMADVTWDWSRPYLLGIVNVTPDSFSDGGRFDDPARAIAHAEQLLDEGADAIDIGGESTRPGSHPVRTDEEIARVVPVITALAARGVVISIDTCKSAVAEAAFSAGARILNDVGTGESAERLGAVAARHGGAYIAMHARGTPATMAQLTHYDDLLGEVSAALSTRTDELHRAGVARERIVIDPGLGFAKRADQSLTLLGGIARMRALGYAVCVGPSRKSFIDTAAAYPAWTVTRSPAHERLGGTAAAVAIAVMAGAEIVRVHDVKVMREAARVAHGIRCATREGG